MKIGCGKKVVLTCAAAVFFLATLACAEEPACGAGAGWSARGGSAEGGNPEGRNRKERFENIVKKLDLTPEQRAEIEQHRTEEGKKAKEVRKSLRARQKELREKLGDRGTERSEVAGIVSEISALQRALLEHRVDTAFLMKDVLSPEQYEKFKNMVSEKMKKFKRMRGKFHGQVRPQERG